jgi:AhpD family alkylhydroperoxidase
MSRLKTLNPGEGNEAANALMADLQSKKMLLNLFRGMANSPAVLDGYLKFSSALSATKLDAKTRHAIALAVGQANGCEYCLSAHTHLGKAVGLNEGEIRDSRLGRSADARRSAAITLARRLVQGRGQVSDADLAAARAGGLGDGELAEVVALTALNLFTNYFNLLNQTEVDLPKVPVAIA